MTYEHDDHYPDRVPVSPYYETSFYLDGIPNGIAIGQAALKVNLSNDNGEQLDVRMNAATVRNLRLALQRAERWMAKVDGSDSGKAGA